MIINYFKIYNKNYYYYIIISLIFIIIIYFKSYNNNSFLSVNRLNFCTLTDNV